MEDDVIELRTLGLRIQENLFHRKDDLVTNGLERMMRYYGGDGTNGG
jgi:hypothetical protein